MKTLLLIITLTLTASATPSTGGGGSWGNKSESCIQLDKDLHKATMYASKMTMNKDIDVSIQSQEDVIELLSQSINKCDRGMIKGLHKMTMKIHMMSLSMLNANRLK